MQHLVSMVTSEAKGLQVCDTTAWSVRLTSGAALLSDLQVNTNEMPLHKLLSSSTLHACSLAFQKVSHPQQHLGKGWFNIKPLSNGTASTWKGEGVLCGTQTFVAGSQITHIWKGDGNRTTHSVFLFS